MDQTLLRNVLSQFTSGVTVVTMCHQGQANGITVSAFCSLSLDPPLVLICIDQRSHSHNLIRESDVFAVNILAEDGEWLSRHFSSRAGDKFANIPHTIGESGAPLLPHILAAVECRLVNVVPGGDHTIFIGEVIAAHVYNNAGPLLYHQRAYHRLTHA